MSKKKQFDEKHVIIDFLLHEGVKSKPNNTSITSKVSNDNTQCANNTVIPRLNNLNDDDKQERVIIDSIGNFMPAGVHENLVSKAHNIKVKNYLGTTREIYSR